jgi:hypothetical protein
VPHPGHAPWQARSGRRLLLGAPSSAPLLPARLLCAPTHDEGDGDRRQGRVPAAAGTLHRSAPRGRGKRRRNGVGADARGGDRPRAAAGAGPRRPCARGSGSAHRGRPHTLGATTAPNSGPQRRRRPRALWAAAHNRGARRRTTGGQRRAAPRISSTGEGGCSGTGEQLCGQAGSWAVANMWGETSPTKGRNRKDKWRKNHQNSLRIN